MTRLTFEIILPVLPTPHDVLTRRLSYSIGGADVVTVDMSPTDVLLPGLLGEDGDTLSVTLVDIDDAGNSSEPREQEFVLSDTIPPSQPGEIGVRVTGEELA
jgi:hypothetical protein